MSDEPSARAKSNFCGVRSAYAIAEALIFKPSMSGA